MPYDPRIHHRRSIRLKGYDYSQSGYYFITLYVKNGLHLFGEIMDHRMILNDAGRMVEKWFEELEHKYPDIECGEYMVMPNHFHCIIFNNGHGNPKMQNNAGIVNIPNAPADADADAAAVRANLCVCPSSLSERNVCPSSFSEKKAGPDEMKEGKHIDLQKEGKHIGLPLRQDAIFGEHPGSPLRSILQWYKTMTTNEYIRGVKNLGWQRFEGKLWLINYWEHIIRTQHSYDTIEAYILHNPQNWDTDQLKDP